MTLESLRALGVDLSPMALLADFVFSVVGVYVYRAGRRRLNQGLIWSGVALCVYPLFLTGALNLWVAGLALCGVAYYFDQRPDSP